MLCNYAALSLLGPVRAFITPSIVTAVVISAALAQAGFGFLGPEQDGDPREDADDPTEGQTLPSRRQPARRREKLPQALHDSRLLSCPVRPRLDTATALEVSEVSVEKQPI